MCRDEEWCGVLGVYYSLRGIYSSSSGSIVVMQSAHDGVDIHERL